MESGLSGTSFEWARVRPALARAGRVCSYDRAGLGWSDPSPRPRTSPAIAEELHALLGRAGVPPPYVLVGHSDGGLHVRLFAAKYPAEVAGVVLVDASHEDQGARLPGAREADEGLMREARWSARTAPLGWNRLRGEEKGRYPEPLQSAYEAVADRRRRYVEVFDQLAAFDESAAAARAAGGLGDVPLLVLSRDPRAPGTSPRDEGPSEALQTDWLRLSRRAEGVVVTGSHHGIPRERPAAVAIEIERFRAGLGRPPGE